MKKPITFEQLLLRLELHAEAINADLMKFIVKAAPLVLSKHNMQVISNMSQVLEDYKTAITRLKETQGFQHDNSKHERNTIQSKNIDPRKAAL